MKKFFAHVGVSLASSAVALLLASWLVPGVELRLNGFLIAVAVFTLAQAIFTPIATKLAAKYADWLVGGIGIISTLLALWIATIAPNGLTISGTLAWVVTPLLVWAFAAAGTLLIHAFFKGNKIEAARAASKAAGN